MARFCFLSEAGQFEYYIEYEEDQGTPNLLLYYDEDDQWPAVYKSNKNCHARESVLRPEQNQIVNLSTRFPFSEAAGCRVPPAVTTPRTKYTYIVPTLSTKPTTRKTTHGKTIITQKVTISFSTTESDDYSTTDGSTISTTSNNYEENEIIESTTQFSDITSTYSISSSDTTYSSPSTLNLLNDEVTLPTNYYQTDVVNIDEENPPIRKRKRSADGTTPVHRLHQDGAARIIRQGRTVTCRNARRFRTARERWWFIAVSNCRGNRGIHIRYRMLMTNGDPGDYWHEHFSADEFYVLPVLMAFSVAYSFLLLAIIICSIELKSRQLLHSTYKLFVFSTLIQFFGIVFKSMCYLKYAVNGLGSPGLRVMGNMFMGMSETCFLLLLLLLAKGYTVTRGRLPLSAGVKVTIFMCLYVVTYISLFIYEAKVFDPGEVLYTYESPAGYGLIILRIAAWCMFIYSTVFTLKHYPEKANFYYPFNVFGTLWYIAGPAFIISANTYIDKWVRESVVCAVLLFITFGGHLMFLLLTMPSVANKNFPYHVRTTQIGVMEQCGDIGPNSIEQFTRHAYEPTSNGLDQTVIVPLSRRTEDLFSGLYSQQQYTSTSASRRNDSLHHDAILHNEHDPRMSETSMENVLSWSLAKNFNTIDPPRMDRRLSAALQEARRSSGDIPLSRQETAEANGSHVLQDWIREVPVELFTVSKAVATKTSVNSPQETHSPSAPESNSLNIETGKILRPDSPD
ncbi:transmembrane protein 145-like isoform X2 [Atheta coriaria]